MLLFSAVKFEHSQSSGYGWDICDRGRGRGGAVVYIIRCWSVHRSVNPSVHVWAGGGPSFDASVRPLKIFFFFFFWGLIK